GWGATRGSAPGSSQPVAGSRYAIRCNASDDATPPNAATPTTFMYTIVVDNLPVIVAPDIPAEATSAAGASVTCSPTASDPDPGDSVVSFTCSPPLPAAAPPRTAVFPLGVTTVTCNATDTQG